MNRPLALPLLAASLFLAAPLAAQTTVFITNASFESPTPSTFPDYTVGATGWTRTSSSINAGTFSPANAGTTPTPIDGVQVGYADGFGGLQQVLSTTFLAGQVYTFSVHVGFRSDEVNSAFGTGAITLGVLNGSDFTALSTQSVTVGRGLFSFVTGTYQSTVGVQGETLVLRLTSTTSYQTLFDQTQITYSAVPEPATTAAGLGVGVLALTGWRRRRRQRRANSSQVPQNVR